jgi:penicillin-binding protein 1C
LLKQKFSKFKKQIAETFKKLPQFFNSVKTKIIFWKKKPPQKKFPKALRIILSIFGIVILLIFFGYIYIAYFLPLPDLLTTPQNLPTTKIYDRHGELLYEVLNPEQGRKTYLKLDQIPQDFINATIASEDKNFYEHQGVDFNAIGRAIFFNALEQRITSGASTITQQLVRNLLGFNRERNLQEKLIEAAYAVRISNLYDKNQILEKYLNTVYYGSMAYGAQTASLSYFNKNLQDLDLAHYSFLAGIPQAPTKYNPYINFANTKKRQQYVLEQMQKQGMITQERVEEAMRESITLRKNVTTIKAPHFVHYVLNQLDEKYGEDMVNFGGLTVTTTLDYPLQQQGEKFIEYQLSRLQQKHVTDAAILAVSTGTNQILTWIGSADYFNDEIDGQVDLVTSLRQPGSALKPFLYLLAFEKGYTPASILDDLPLTFETATGPYSPKNYDLDYHGPVRARIALANSYNIPAVQLLSKIGIVDFIRFLQKLGFESLDREPDFYGLSVTLGGGEIKLYEMVRAYSVLANQGSKSDLSAILEVKKGDQVLEKWKQPVKERVLGNNARQNSFLITDILSDANARLQSFGEGNVLELDFPVAAKTGTTRNFKDNWTMGYTTEIVTGVWVGNADATAMQNISGIDGAGPIWNDFMNAAHRQKHPAAFQQPSGLQKIEICSDSGLLSTALCARPVFEFFRKGTEPKQPDNFYQEFNCLENGQTATKTYINYPQKYQKWAKDRDLLPPENCSLKNPAQVSTSVQSSDSSSGQPGNRSSGNSSEQSSGNSSDQSSEYSEAVSITSPILGDSFQINHELPLTAQKIPIRYTINMPLSKLTILIDDQPIETFTKNNQNKDQQAELSVGAQSTSWEPKTGQHTLKFETQNLSGQTATTQPLIFEVK